MADKTKSGMEYLSRTSNGHYGRFGYSGEYNRGGRDMKVLIVSFGGLVCLHLPLWA
jgi:hypothetical protein